MMEAFWLGPASNVCGCLGLLCLLTECLLNQCRPVIIVPGIELAASRASVEALLGRATFGPRDGHFYAPGAGGFWYYGEHNVFIVYRNDSLVSMSGFRVQLGDVFVDQGATEEDILTIFGVPAEKESAVHSFFGDVEIWSYHHLRLQFILRNFDGKFCLHCVHYGEWPSQN